MRGRWDAKNNPRDYRIARNFKSGLRDWRTLLGTLLQREQKIDEEKKEKKEGTPVSPHFLRLLFNSLPTI